MASPVAGDDHAEISVQDPDHKISGNLLANDSDPDGGAIFLRFVDGIRVGAKGTDTIVGTYGTFTFHADGSYVYTLDMTNPAVIGLASGAKLTESLNYKISDGTGATDFALFKLDITGPNTRPTAVDDHLSINIAGGDDLSGNVLTNDHDSDGDTLQVSFIGTAPHTYIPTDGGTVTYAGLYGSITIGRDGNFVYHVDEAKAAAAGLTDTSHLTEHFTYKIYDGELVNSADQGDIFINITDHASV